jgi:hypothetical protein
MEGCGATEVAPCVICVTVRRAELQFGRNQQMGAGHFIYIPVVLLIGIILGWVLGSRAVRDAYAAEMKRQKRRQGDGIRDPGSGIKNKG